MAAIEIEIDRSKGARGVMTAYAQGFCIYVILGALGLIALAYAFILRSGELMHVNDVVTVQLQGDPSSAASSPLYGPALSQDNFQYKLALVAKRRPEIVAIGSSRLQQIRQLFFDRPFANLSGNMNNPDEGKQLANAMLALHVPRLAIINLDFWWFNPLYPYVRDFPNHRLDGAELRGEDYALLSSWMLSGRVSIVELFRTILEPDISVSGLPSGIGIRARMLGEGFAPDGAEFDFGLINGSRPAWDRDFSQALTRIRDGKSGTDFQYGNGFSEEAWHDFTQLLSHLQQNGVKSAVFIPPIARIATAEMQRRLAQYPHLQVLKERIRQLNVPVFDFSDLGELGGTDCEFIDALHVGEVGALRIVRAIAMEPQSPFFGTVNIPWADDALNRAAGHVLLPEDLEASRVQETDFLNLGCRRETALSKTSAVR